MMTDHTQPISRTVQHDYSGHTLYLLMVAYAEQRRALVSGNWSERERAAVLMGAIVDEANRRQVSLDKLESLA
jgi:hypothetical protein